MGKTVKVTLAKEKETKGAVKYTEVTEKGEPVEFADSVLGTQYVRKTAFNGSIPDKISVTVSW